MSSAAFRTRIRTSIANESLQAALDANAARRVSGRITAFASLPDWRERRQRAHAVRAEVIEHLDQYLDQFIRKVSQNGILVHRVADAAEAVKAVLEIARASARAGHEILVAKSKSMVSEEIELNHALEREHIRVVETDLGEYIVQLRGEKPAHIITPAVHLRRHEVGQLFQQQLGLPYTEDIPTLTAAARRVLRQIFLTADVGISGVNFGVAETGTLCIVTNEGNGRMVTTMPPVHIALMGMERLLPRLEDLPLMLSLLPRSATGQKLSVYTQLLHGPRASGEADGARERHLIIVDNGRSRLRGSPLKEALYCIRCGACLNACPVFREIGGHAYVGSDGSIAPYPGPIGSIVSPGLLGLEQFGHLAQASSLCGACKDACPVDIDLPRLLTRVRAGDGEQAHRKGGVGLSRLSRAGLLAYGVIGSSPRLFSLAQTLGGIGTSILSPLSDWIRIPAFTGWGYSKDFPRVATKTFRKRFQHQKRADEERPGTVHAPAEERTMQEAAEPAVDRFSRELEALGGQAQRVAADKLDERLAEFLKKRGVKAVLAWDEIPGLNMARLREAGISASSRPDPNLRVGITGIRAAIAETGTLVIASSATQPLTASLLPEIHVAIVRSSQIVRTLDEALRDTAIPDATAAVLISGPSRTADIEMTLTIGVHGPKELVVFIVG
ncbi:MAG TPA: LUD domain-containing protein [Anaerolineales bacterium]